MKITSKTYTTYTLERALSVRPPDIQAGSGVYYRPDSDERAYSEAQLFHKTAAAQIRQASKSEELPVELRIEARDGVLFAVCSGMVTR